MSPRSQEFMDMARERLSDAQKIFDVAHPALIVSAAYYAMLYAARAALSERDSYAKTHSGTWTLFSERFVATGAFDRELYGFTGRAQEARQEGDYQAKPLTPELARELLDAAERFLAAIEAMIAPPTDAASTDLDPTDRSPARLDHSKPRRHHK